MKKPTPTYHIIGGGLTGLCCAKFAKEKNPKARTIIYEAAGRIGGRCYSYHDTQLDHRLDNALHVAVGANKEMRNLLGESDWHNKCWFWNAKNSTSKVRPLQYVPHILMSMCNTPALEIARPILRKILFKLFPFTPSKRKIYFSQQDLSQRLINPLMQYVDVLYTDCRLNGFENHGCLIKKLQFNNFEVALDENDVVISALDDKNYTTLFGGEHFEHESIVNIFYRTSQNITLQNKAPIVGVVNGISDWIIVDKDIISATISAAQPFEYDQDELARRVWQEIGDLRGVNQAFIPPYRVAAFKAATIKQDEANNNKRPTSACTGYHNLLIAGDWTMKDWPCCLEAAVQSAKRAIKTKLKRKE